GGACRAVSVARGAVRSYRTISTLPLLAQVGGIISVALSLRSPWADVIRHRVSVEPGLSSTHRLRDVPRPSGHLTRVQYRAELRYRNLACRPPWSGSVNRFSNRLRVIATD